MKQFLQESLEECFWQNPEATSAEISEETAQGITGGTLGKTSKRISVGFSKKKNC